MIGKPYPLQPDAALHIAHLANCYSAKASLTDDHLSFGRNNRATLGGMDLPLLGV